MVVSPPCLLPGVGLLSRLKPSRAAWSSHQLNRAISASPTCGLADALQQQFLRAEDLGRLREDRGAALADHCIGHPTDQRIGGDARPAVAAPAFECQRQPGQGLRVATAGVHLWQQTLDRRDPGRDRAAEAALALDGEPRGLP